MTTTTAIRWRFQHDEGNTVLASVGTLRLRVEHNGTDYSWQIRRGDSYPLIEGTCETIDAAMMAAEDWVRR